GDVHQRADRAQAGTAQALGHPQRRARGRVQALDDAAAEARAVGAGFQAHFETAVAADRRFRDLQRIDLHTEGGGDVEGDATHAEAVGAVRGRSEEHTSELQSRETLV